MIQMICAGWIFGISFLGKNIEYYLQLSSVIFYLFIIVLVTLFVINLRIRSIFLRLINAICAFALACVIGMNYSNEQLIERLKYRVQQTNDVEVIVAVNSLNQLKPETIQQQLVVLNQFEKPVIWNSSLKTEQFKPLQIGQYYRLQGKVSPIHSYATAGVFDIEQWYIQQNWMGNFQIKHIELLSEEQVKVLGYASYIKKNKSFTAKFKRWVELQRLDIRHFIQKQPIQHKGLTLALLTGDESFLNKQIEEQFQRFGMSHLLAISGPHVLIFACMVCWLIHQVIKKYCPKVYLKTPKQYFLIHPFLGCVFLYCAYVGFEIPALRTLLMTLLASVWVLLKYPIKPLSLLLLSASLLLLFDPFSILSAAFWLSYGACFVLLRIYQTIQEQNFEQQSLIQKSISALKILVESQWKIFIALFPLMIILFTPKGVLPKTWMVICLFPLLWNDSKQYPFELSILDVGQGQSIFLRSEETTVMVDTGGYYDETKFSVGKQIIRPFLSVNGVRTIDYLFLTHLDQDHSGAFEYLKDKVNFKYVYSSEQVEIMPPSQFEYCKKGQVFQINHYVKIEVLAPKAEQLALAKYDKNENSCVLYIQVLNAQKYQNYLLMGDAGWQTEYEILQAYPNLKVDVLVLGHHGSQHSSSYGFLEKLRPKVAVVSAGFNNRYGHPSKIVEARLKALDIPILSTIQDGTIQFIQDGNSHIEIKKERDHRLWLRREISE